MWLMLLGNLAPRIEPIGRLPRRSLHHWKIAVPGYWEKQDIMMGQRVVDLMMLLLLAVVPLPLPIKRIPKLKGAQSYTLD